MLWPPSPEGCFPVCQVPVPRAPSSHRAPGEDLGPPGGGRADRTWPSPPGQREGWAQPLGTHPQRLPCDRDARSCGGESVKPRGRTCNCPLCPPQVSRHVFLPGRCLASVQTDPLSHAAPGPHSSFPRGSGTGARRLPHLCHWRPPAQRQLLTAAGPTPQGQGRGWRGLTPGLASVPTDSTTGMTRGVRR